MQISKLSFRAQSPPELDVDCNFDYLFEFTLKKMFDGTKFLVLILHKIFLRVQNEIFIVFCVKKMMLNKWDVFIALFTKC